MDLSQWMNLGGRKSIAADCACQCDASSPLNVIVEYAGFLSVLSQQLEGIVVGKVLELHQQVGPPLLQACHEAVQDFMICSASQPRLSHALSINKPVH